MVSPAIRFDKTSIYRRKLGRDDVSSMTVASQRRTSRRAGPVIACTAALVLMSQALGGCTSIADLPFEAPSGAAERSHDVSSYPAVHDLPAPRDHAAMDRAEQARVEKELIDARDHQAHASQDHHGSEPR